MSTRTDDEQIEVIKAYIREHGSKVLLAIAIVIAAYSGFQLWKNNTQQAKETASIYYNELTVYFEKGDINDNDRNRFNEIFSRLSDEYPSSRYTIYAALGKAKLEVDAGELEQAQQSLQWAKKQSKDAQLKALANYRLARVTSALGQHQQALDLLVEDAAGLEAQYEQSKGDIYAAMEKNEQAINAYRQAKNLLQQSPGANTQLLDLKINFLDEADGVELQQKKQD